MIVKVVTERNKIFKPLVDTEVPNVEGLAEIAMMCESKGIELKNIKRRQNDTLIMIFQGNGAK